MHLQASLIPKKFPGVIPPGPRLKREGDKREREREEETRGGLHHGCRGDGRLWLLLLLTWNEWIILPALSIVQIRCSSSVISPWQTTSLPPFSLIAWFGLVMSGGRLTVNRALPPVEYSTRSREDLLMTRTSPVRATDSDHTRCCTCQPVQPLASLL